MSSRDESNLNPSEVRARLRTFEDFNLAIRLQDQEFNTHFDRNRSERRLVGGDTRVSRKEQDSERARIQQIADMQRRQQDHIAQSDEELARRYQAEIEQEERRFREVQEARDAELARRLEQEEQTTSTPSTSTFAPSHGHSSIPNRSTISSNPPVNVPIADLLTGDNLNLDENTQNELNTLADPSPLFHNRYGAVQQTTAGTHQTTTFGVYNHVVAPSVDVRPVNPPLPSAYSPCTTNAIPSIRSRGVPLPGLAQPPLQTVYNLPSYHEATGIPSDSTTTVPSGYNSDLYPRHPHPNPIGFTPTVPQTYPQTTVIPQFQQNVQEMSRPMVVTHSTVPTVIPPTPSNMIPMPAISGSHFGHLAPEPTFSSSVGFASPLENFHPTNPFLTDVQTTNHQITNNNIITPTSSHPGVVVQPVAGNNFYSEFGLPPPSELALGRH